MRRAHAVAPGQIFGCPSNTNAVALTYEMWGRGQLVCISTNPACASRVRSNLRLVRTGRAHAAVAVKSTLLRQRRAGAGHSLDDCPPPLRWALWPRVCGGGFRHSRIGGLHRRVEHFILLQLWADTVRAHSLKMPWPPRRQQTPSLVMRAALP